MYIDCHCHLDFCRENEGIDKIIERARKNKVEIIISNGVNFESNRNTIRIGDNFKEVKVALGLYPIDALRYTDKEIDKEIDFIRNNKEKIIAIGEVGLDFKEDIENWEKQKKNFDKMIKLSIELNKVIIVHSRKAEKECVEILEKNNAKKVIMHCFSGNFNLVERIRKNGWFFTIPTSVIRSEHFQKIVKETDMKQLLCETDSPFLHPFKEKNNEPSNVIEGYKKTAEIKEIGLKDVEKAIEDNFSKLFY